MAPVGNEIGMIDQSAKPRTIAAQERATYQLKNALPGGNAGGSLPVENESVRSLVREILGERVGLFAVEFLDDPFVLFAVVLPSLLVGFEADAGVLLDEGGKFAGDLIEGGSLCVVSPLEFDPFVQRPRIIVVDGEPDVVGEREEIFSHSFEVFENLAGPNCGPNL